MNSRLRQYVVTALAVAVGLALFTYAVRTAGVDEIVNGVRRVGWGLALILLLAGVRFALRAECWRWCMPSDARPSRLRVFTVFLAGDSIGSVTPFGLLASEPAKVFLIRQSLATRVSIASLVAENFVYAASVLVVVVAGLLILLAVWPLDPSWRFLLQGALAVLVVGALVVAWLLWSMLGPQRDDCPRWSKWLTSIVEEMVAVGSRLGIRLWGIFWFDLIFHAVAVIEVYLTLDWLLGDLNPTVAQAIVFEALNRVITVAFKFVPFRIGVDEASSGVLAPMLALNPATGVALAVVRKARSLLWAGVGLLLVLGHPVPIDEESN